MEFKGQHCIVLRGASDVRAAVEAVGSELRGTADQWQTQIRRCPNEPIEVRRPMSDILLRRLLEVADNGDHACKHLTPDVARQHLARLGFKIRGVPGDPRLLKQKYDT